MIAGLKVIFIIATLTSYRSVPNQTDDSPDITSVGQKTSETGTAVSQDLIKNQTACYGDVLLIPGVGFRIVNDTMNLRHMNSVDIWVPTLNDERKIGLRKNVQILVIQSPKRYCGGSK